jgi:peptidoglycan hydrolase-like protein with peptidoglycan-binding domain
MMPVSTVSYNFAALLYDRLRSLRSFRLPSQAIVRLLSVLTSLAIVSMASAAHALLQRGDSGATVRDLQNRLTAVGCYDGPITDYFGSLTEAGVKRCQARYGLTQDGIYGPRTEAALFGQTATPTVPAATQPVSNRLLQRGDRGVAVQDLQFRLTRLGYNPGPIDGIYGSRTETAVRQFQSGFGLVPTGIYGTTEQQALLAQTGGGGGGNVADPVSRSLQVGDSGADVEQLQRRLQELGFFQGSSATGYYGPITREAVLAYQRSQRLNPSGTADRTTLASLGLGGAGGAGGVPLAPTTQRRYTVIVPKQDWRTAQAVRNIFPGALELSSRLGTYLQTGVFSRRENAERQSDLLRAQGLDARVVYQ